MASKSSVEKTKEELQMQRYHHTLTSISVHPREADVDSEDESDLDLLLERNARVIDEFIDVNEGEKALMKLWNSHVAKYKYVSDCKIPLVCKSFVELCGEELIEKNLYRNFCLHLTNLFDNGLLTKHSVHTTIEVLQSQMQIPNPAPLLGENGNVAQENNLHPVNNGGINGADISVAATATTVNNGGINGADISVAATATTVNNGGINGGTIDSTSASATPGPSGRNKIEVKDVKVKLKKLNLTPGPEEDTVTIGNTTIKIGTPLPDDVLSSLHG